MRENYKIIGGISLIILVGYLSITVSELKHDVSHEMTEIRYNISNLNIGQQAMSKEYDTLKLLEKIDERIVTIEETKADKPTGKK